MIQQGKFWKNMGHVEDGKQLLFPEEALFLIDEVIEFFLLSICQTLRIQDTLPSTGITQYSPLN